MSSLTPEAYAVIALGLGFLPRHKQSSGWHQIRHLDAITDTCCQSHGNCLNLLLR
jgi:hypothetical protein